MGWGCGGCCGVVGGGRAGGAGAVGYGEAVHSALQPVLDGSAHGMCVLLLLEGAEGLVVRCVVSVGEVEVLLIMGIAFKNVT